MFARFFAIFLVCFSLASPALADVKLATVDFQKALNDVAEGAQARARLESMYGERKAAIDKMRMDLESKTTDYQKQQTLLSDSARKAKEDELGLLTMQYQQAAGRAEGEMQQAYAGAMETLVEKMKKISQAIAAERGYTLVLEVTQGAVVYSVPGLDITDELIKRYNAQNPVK